MNGQVYRLLVAKTYEMHMFKTASKKLGLDQAVLGGTRPQKGQDKNAPTKAEVGLCYQRAATAATVASAAAAAVGRWFVEFFLFVSLSFC